VTFVGILHALNRKQRDSFSNFEALVEVSYTIYPRKKCNSDNLKWSLGIKRIKDGTSTVKLQFGNDYIGREKRIHSISDVFYGYEQRKT
jgi:hypothetical protein